MRTFLIILALCIAVDVFAFDARYSRAALQGAQRIADGTNASLGSRVSR
jgi:hypothetical protein